MKKLVFILSVALAFAASSFVASAQQPDDCMLYMSYYQEYYKQGTKDAKMAAIPSWRKAYEICAPGTRQNLYIHGADLYRMLIAQNAKNPELREALIDTLLTLHKVRAQYYPKYAAKAYAALSADVNNYLKNDPEKTHKVLSEIIAEQGAETTPVAFVANMNAAVALYKDGKLSVDQLINEYDLAMNCFGKIQQVDTTQETRNLRATVENAFINSRAASCENLQTLFASRFEENKEDIDQVTKIVKLMASAEDCTDNDLFLKAVTQMHALEPSANSAYYLYRLHAGNKDTQIATRYLEEAVASDELDAQTKSQYMYELAAYSLKNGMYAKAVEAANKAMSSDEGLSGKCYMLIAHAWMGANCGGNEVERRAKYWVAVDYFNRAKAADASLAEDANKQIGACVSYYPETAEAFMYDFQNGQSYSVTCGGLRATTTVRTK